MNKEEVKPKSEQALEEASKYAALAEQAEQVKNFKQASEYNKQAGTYYLEALACLKQRPNSDKDALRTLELLADTHRRKSKILDISVDQYQGKSHGQLIQDQMRGLRREKQIASGKAPFRPRGADASSGGAGTEEEEQRKKTEQSLREKHRQKMSEPLVILDKVVFDQYTKEFETLIEYHSTKLEKLENRIQKVLDNLKNSFIDQSHEDSKFISVNPFAPLAQKESINVQKIDKINKKLEDLLDALKKLRSLQAQQQTGMMDKFNEIVKKENSYHINFGQLTALATTQVGQAIGMTQVLLSKDQTHYLIEEMQKQLISQELFNSMLKGSEYASGPNGGNQQNQESNSVPHSKYIQEIQNRDGKIKQLEEKLENVQYKLKLHQQQRSEMEQVKQKEIELAELKASYEKLNDLLSKKDLEIAEQKVQYKKCYEKYRKYFEHCQKWAENKKKAAEDANAAKKD